MGEGQQHGLKKALGRPVVQSIGFGQRHVLWLLSESKGATSVMPRRDALMAPPVELSLFGQNSLQPA